MAEQEKSKKPTSESSVLRRALTKAEAFRAVVDELGGDPIAFKRVSNYINTCTGVVALPMGEKPETKGEEKDEG